MNISILETRKCEAKVNYRRIKIPNHFPCILHLRHRSRKTPCFVILALEPLYSCRIDTRKWLRCTCQCACLQFSAARREIYLLCGETVCMSVWCAVDRGVYLVCGVTVCMPASCPVDRGFILLCGEKVILLAQSAVDNGFNISYDATVSVLSSSAVRVCLGMIQLSREESVDPISYVSPAHDFSSYSQARTWISIDIWFRLLYVKGFQKQNFVVDIGCHSRPLLSKLSILFI